MSGHTPGPWRTDPECGNESVLGPKGIMVADCAIFGRGTSQDRNIANARLIAAAPALLAALRLVPAALTASYEEAHAEWQGHDARGRRCNDKVRECREAVAAAIALATQP